MSEGIEASVASTEAISDGERRAISLLHSVTSDRKMAREMSKELGTTIRIHWKNICRMLTLENGYFLHLPCGTLP